jgi:hypothetical protein
VLKFCGACGKPLESAAPQQEISAASAVSAVTTLRATPTKVEHIRLIAFDDPTHVLLTQALTHP